MTICKALTLNEDERAVIKKFLALVRDIADETGLEESSIIDYFYDYRIRGNDLELTHNLDDIEYYGG